MKSVSLHAYFLLTQVRPAFSVCVQWRCVVRRCGYTIQTAVDTRRFSRRNSMHPSLARRMNESRQSLSKRPATQTAERRNQSLRRTKTRTLSMCCHRISHSTCIPLTCHAHISRKHTRNCQAGHHTRDTARRGWSSLSSSAKGDEMPLCITCGSPSLPVHKHRNIHTYIHGYI